MTHRRHRTGWGFDAHRLNDSPPLVLGGVAVSDTRGVDATSDGDVVAHAVTDALLGACVLGDMGEWFPSSNPEFEDADSMALLSTVVGTALAEGWTVEHVDVTVVVETVRVAPHRDRIRESLAKALGLEPVAVSVKATTTDGLGFTGAGSGIAAVAVVTVGGES